MKIIKLTLTLVTIIAIALIAYSFFHVKKTHQTTIPSAPNTLVIEIQKKIENIKRTPATTFCDKEYQRIRNDIEAYANAHSQKLDTSYRESLSKDLDFAYIAVFIRQANTVFEGASWEADHIYTIRKETKKLLDSRYIVNKTELNTIRSTLAKYDEIGQFLANAEIFSKDMHVTRIDQEFDLAGTKDYITKAADYHQMRHLVNNCTRIQTKLAEIPSAMYNKHLGYLRNKVDFCSGKYDAFTDPAQYYNKIYRPAHAEFQTLTENYSLYSVAITTPDEDLTPLKTKLKIDHDSADKHFNSNLK